MKNKIYEIIVRLNILKIKIEEENIKIKKELNEIEEDLYEYAREVNDEK